jgi:hypothetical protein
MRVKIGANADGFGALGAIILKKSQKDFAR